MKTWHTCDVVHVEFVVGDVEQSRVLVHIHHVGVQPGEVQHVLREARQRQLQRQHLPECPVVRRRRECRRSPLSQHTLGHHRGLHLYITN